MSRTRNWTPDPLTKLKAVVTSVKKRQRLGANNGNVIPHPDFLSAREGGKLYNHLQGIQRYGKYVIISGSISSGSRNPQGSQLIVIQMGAKNPSMPWGYPRYQPAASSYDYKHPDPRDKVVAVIPLDRTLWHAGGIQMMGRILAVPLYGKMPDGRPRSHVRFYDFSVPTRPTEIREMRITRPKKAFAVALAGLPDKRTLAIVWDDKTLDFYYSRTPAPRNGNRPSRCQASGFRSFTRRTRSSISASIWSWTLPARTFSWWDSTIQTNYLRSPQTIFDLGKDYADVYTFPAAFDPAKPVNDGTPGQKFKKVKAIYMRSNDWYSSFNADGGTYITPTGDIYIYGSPHWLHADGSRYNYLEYTNKKV